MLRSLGVLLFAAGGSAQDPGTDVATALLRGDRDAAAAAADSLADRAQRARMQAALRPLAERPAAFLAVARAFADDAAADAAILAGAAHCLLALGGEEVVPALDAFEGMVPEEAGEHARLAAAAGAETVSGLCAAWRARVALGGDSPALREAGRLLRAATVSRFDPAPVRVAPATSWPVPSPRAEDLLFRAYRVRPGTVSLADLACAREPDRTELLPAGSAPTSVPALPPGAWVVDLASTHAPWHAVRVVEVSDLDAVLLVDADRLATLAEVDETAVRVDVRTSRSGAADTAVRVDGVGLVPRASGVDAVELTDGRGRSAWLGLPRVGRPAHDPRSWLAHLMLDRPLYRPGETMEARVVLRAVRWQGEGLDARCTVVPGKAQTLTVEAFVGSESSQSFEVSTDALGLAEFTVPVPAEGVRGAVRVRVRRGASEASDVVFDGWPCAVANYERPVLVVGADGPRACRGEARVEVVGRAAWASGGPAVGVEVTATVEARGGTRRREVRELRTGSDGRAVLPIEVAALPRGWVDVDFAFAGPDGRREHARHTFTLAVAPEAAAPPPSAARASSPELAPVPAPELALCFEAPLVVGEPAALRVTGPAWANVLVVAGRGAASAAYRVALDDAGVGRLRVPCDAAAWPCLDVAAATHTAVVTVREPVRRRPPRAPRIELPERSAPGAEVVCRVDVGVPDALVTLAVVDERIFALAADRTEDPATALRPRPALPNWERVQTLPPASPLRLLSELLVGGRVPPLGDRRWPSGFGLAAGGPAAAGAAGAAVVRADFRATAAFVTAVTGADGEASLRFVLPDDLTTWRATVVGVEPDGAAFRLQRALVARTDLAVEPILPRVLRAGDALDLPLVVDRAAAAPGLAPDAAIASVTVAAEGLALGARAVAVAVAPGDAARGSLPARAVQPGVATLDLDARLGPAGDRSRRTLTVAPDSVAHPLATQQSGVGPLVLAPAAGSDAEAGMAIVVLGSGAAVRGVLAERLAVYPHGCVEQTLAGLLPFFAEVRGAAVRGLRPPVMDAAFRTRLATGLRRLRALQVGAGGGFAWWPGEGVDWGMTALVLHGLCVARAGGLDPQAAGIGFDVDRALGADAGGEVLRAEVAAACLRFAPGHAAARAALSGALERRRDWPPGLWLRAGLALCDAGDVDRARACLRGATTSRHADETGFPGEGGLAVRALTLELAHRLGAWSAAEMDAATDALLSAVLVADPGSTYAHACALAALALVQPAEPAPPSLAVRVVVGEQTHLLRLRPEDGFRAELRLPVAAEVRVASEPPAPLRVCLATVRRQRASDHPAWAAPLVVERALLRRAADGTLVELGAVPPRVGERLAVRVRVTSPVNVQYAVIECPLPAGLTLPYEPAWLERFDDRVAFTAGRLGPGRAREVQFEVVATHAGKVLWPPTIAQAMYAASVAGGCAGGWLEVAPAGPVATAAVQPCFVGALPEAPAVAAVPPVPFLELARDVRGLWQEGVDGGVLGMAPEPDAARVQAALDRVAACAGHPDFDAESLDAATELRTWLSAFGDSTDGLRGAAWGAWRVDLCARVTELQRCWAEVAVGRCERGAPAGDQRDALRAASGAVAEWPDVDARERAQARLLGAAQVDGAESLAVVLSTLEGTAHTDSLGDALLACLACAGVRAAAIRHLPRASLVALPPAVLVGAAANGGDGVFDGWLEEGIVAALAQTDAGRRELWRLCRERAFVAENDDRLRAELPRALWGELPAAAFLELAVHADDLDDLVAVLVEASWSNDDLRAAFAQADSAAARRLFVTALWQRRVEALTTEASPPAIVATWSDLLRAAVRADVAALRASYARATEGAPASAALLLDESMLRAFAARAMAACAPPEVLPACADDVPSRDWPATFARLGARGCDRLLAKASEALPELPTPTDAAGIEALWLYGERCDDLTSAIDAIGRREAGARLANARAAALPAGSTRDLAVAHAEDAVAVWTGDAATRVLHLLAAEGRPADWTEAERAALATVLAVRGLR